MQRLLEIPQEVYGFLRNFRLRAGDWNRERGSKTAPFTHPLPGAPTPLAKILILQQALFFVFTHSLHSVCSPPVPGNLTGSVSVFVDKWRILAYNK